MPRKNPETDEAKAANALAQRRWRERLKADPDRHAAYKAKERRRMRLLQAQNEEYAERKRRQHAERYKNDPEFRARSAARNSTPSELQRRRALNCLRKGLSKHLPDQTRILTKRLERLLQQAADH